MQCFFRPLGLSGRKTLLALRQLIFFSEWIILVRITRLVLRTTHDLGPPFRRAAIPGYYCYNNPKPNPNHNTNLTPILTLTLTPGSPEWRAVTTTHVRRKVLFSCKLTSKLWRVILDHATFIPCEVNQDSLRLAWRDTQNGSIRSSFLAVVKTDCIESNWCLVRRGKPAWVTVTPCLCHLYHNWRWRQWRMCPRSNTRIQIMLFLTLIQTLILSLTLTLTLK